MNATNTPPAVYVRWMIRRDIPEVVRLQRTWHPEPWGEEEYLAAMRHRSTIAYVAEVGERIAGVLVYRLHERSLSIHRLSVGTEFHGQNIGANLVLKLIRTLSARRRTRIRADVGERDLQSQLFFRAMGFRCVRTTQSQHGDIYKFVYKMESDGIPGEGLTGG